MKQCRLAITIKCNLRCPYCLMLNKDIVQSFTRLTYRQWRERYRTTPYSALCITGGEPLLDLETLSMVLVHAKTVQPDTPIYLYTNGVLMDGYRARRLKGWVSGVSWGVHGALIPVKRIVDTRFYLPVRLYRREDLVDMRLEHWCRGNQIELRPWKQDVCDTPEEDRFILEDRYGILR